MSNCKHIDIDNLKYAFDIFMKKVKHEMETVITVEDEEDGNVIDMVKNTLNPSQNS